MIRALLSYFLAKYEKRYRLYTGITAGLFLLQVVHLYWLTTYVVFGRLWGIVLFDPNVFWQFIIILIDYAEIPAIISTSILYLHSLGKKWSKKDFFLLALLNSQWLHIFWISDEFVVDMLLGQVSATVLPFWLAWVAIVIDYLELPVMYDTTKKFIASLAPGSVIK
ncbi:hypothetical protein HYZ76_00760 [Candidatus Falkowbacteria bacterium]|nr:hypothetical protein [Candidatus Falkowbacteria bacterium]